MDLPKNYDAKESERKWSEYWLKNRIYKFDKKSKKKIYSIDTPPPTVSGKMHIGHAFSYAQEDFIARYKRMRGYNVFYPFGTDDNGLPTDKLVEKTKKVRSLNMERSEYVDLCLKTVLELKPEFIRPWQELGVSCDFEESYSTIDKTSQKTAQLSFLNLYKKGLIYQEESPVTWCPKCQTAIAQAEFENVDMNSNFNDIVFHCGGKDLIISTTRPELLSACVALAVNPKDDRYKEVVGKHAKVPLFDYEVPIISDETVAIEKGTGLMMVCTFGDKEDIEKWYKYKLPLKIVINKNGTMNEKAEKYEGMKLLDARKAMIDDLKEKNLLIKQEKIVHAVNLHERCGTEVEFLKTKQWFVKILDKKQELIEAADKINWYPKHMKVRYIHWVENLNWDWCISRQRHYGVPMPIWYSTKNNDLIFADVKELPVDPTRDIPKNLPKDHTPQDLEPEMDVFDTWMTSSLSPQIALKKVINDTKGSLFKENYPMSMRPQAHDIIRTWAFYTIVKGIFEEGIIPWDDIVISGHALDPKGKKMSKSKGNVVDPLVVMEKYNSDALRFWAAGSKLGEDLPYQEKDLVTGQKMITKLWNASKFCFMHLEDFDKSINPELEMMDKWLFSKLNKMIKECTEKFDEYEYSKTKADAEQFFWQMFCDNYLEIAKGRLYNPDTYGKDATNSARYTLYHGLQAVLKLFAPIMPFITEEIFQMYFSETEGEKSIHTSLWPVWNEMLIDNESEEIGDVVVEIVGFVRRYKSEKNLSLKTPIKRLSLKITKDLIDGVKKATPDLKDTTKSEEIDVVVGNKLEIDIEL